MPRREAPRQHPSISLNVKLGGVFWTKFEHALSKIPTKEASPAVARFTRPTTEKYSLLFSFCARRISFSLNGKSIFLWCSALESRTAGLASFRFCKGKAEFLFRFTRWAARKKAKIMEIMLGGSTVQHIRWPVCHVLSGSPALLSLSLNQSIRSAGWFLVNILMLAVFVGASSLLNALRQSRDYE